MENKRALDRAFWQTSYSIIGKYKEDWIWKIGFRILCQSHGAGLFVKNERENNGKEEISIGQNSSDKDIIKIAPYWELKPWGIGEIRKRLICYWFRIKGSSP